MGSSIWDQKTPGSLPRQFLPKFGKSKIYITSRLNPHQPLLHRMPNDCWNNLTIIGSKEDIARYAAKELKKMDGQTIPEWAIKVECVGSRGIIYKVWSRWQPEFHWLEGLLDKYPSLWIKDEWSEEGGYEGVWVGTVKEGEKVIQRMEWMGLCLEERASFFEPSFET